MLDLDSRKGSTGVPTGDPVAVPDQHSQTTAVVVVNNREVLLLNRCQVEVSVRAAITSARNYISRSTPTTPRLTVPDDELPSTWFRKMVSLLPSNITTKNNRIFSKRCRALC